jgi:hypothetical protein
VLCQIGAIPPTHAILGRLLLLLAGLRGGSSRLASKVLPVGCRPSADAIILFRFHSPACAHWKSAAHHKYGAALGSVSSEFVREASKTQDFNNVCGVVTLQQ